ncbi:endolytic transglycosylase MltG [Candidatus Daviesbacteria bacterium]|nr:endolytic transglycosylase MltG [Candidatus Daviesbacteria bacterium]
MKNNSWKKILAWIIILAVPFFIAKSYWNFLKSPTDEKGQSVAFVVKRGESVANIIQRLKEENFIRSEWIFKFELKQSGKDGEIAAGDYKLSTSMSTDEIIKNLTSGSIDRWVTLIEGWRVEEVAEALNSKFEIRNSKFIAMAKEGYMFPDTYLFNPDATAETIAQTMRANFDKKYNTDLVRKINALGLTADEGVILASIVEREARSDEVRRMVASILLKRLNIGMGLNADATLQYALGYQKDEKSWWKRHITAGDKKVDSPYNTYLYRGLPPKPICNPSLSSLKAVSEADPATPYLYYYHDSKGNSYYAKTLDEHNQNVANHP